MTLAAEIKKQAGALGFDLVGVASVEPSAHIDLFRSWVEGGAQGDMSYLSREDALARRADLKLTLPSLKAAVLTSIQLQANARVLATARGFGQVNYLSPGEIERMTETSLGELSVTRAWEYFRRRAGMGDS